MGLGICDGCKRLKWVKSHDVETGPGSGRIVQYCDNCWATRRPKNWSEKMGISQSQTVASDAKVVRYIGFPRITASEYGPNAFGSILAEMSDGSHTGVICGHGGSGWLCLECAMKILGT